MSNVIRIAPEPSRHKRNAKDMLRCACDVIGKVKKVEGFVVIAWDQRGTTDFYCKAGGMISSDLVPEFVHDQIQRRE